ncbi:sensor histidine kinase [Pseudoduganella namucuonensis]|uniref:Signal transduction histidine kinase n=1 Tax=Pseudoduganella namucuonensis TaxID=1035707 RepID=A0A1I7LU30_9BURK|nr:CHASE domain-containing protein [Pseudoduganella namucuonensis]SFV13256.1 Signal transduction histidine kinase [Pseudoduganella namucuonensis]
MKFHVEIFIVCTLFTRRKYFWFTNSLYWIGLPLSLAVGILLYGLTQRSIENDASERFRSQARSSQLNVIAGIKAYTDVLRGMASFFHSVDTVTHDNFHRYVQGLDLARNFPAIVRVDFALDVPKKRQALVERDGYADVSHGVDEHPGVSITQSAEPHDAAVIALIESTADLKKRLGTDIATLPATARALVQSRDSGAMIASAQPSTLDTSPIRPEISLRLPAYRGSHALDTVEKRHDAYKGSVGIGFCIYRLLMQALEKMPVNNTRLILHDIGGHSDRAMLVSDNGGTLLFDSAAPDKTKQQDAGEFSYEMPIDFHGHTWRARFTAPKESLNSSFDTLLPWLALLTGFAGTMLTYALFHAQSSSHLRAIRMAKAMTKELRKSQAKLQLSHQKLRGLAAHAEQIKEEERKRIAREIHDDLGQNLLALRIEADLLTTRTSHRHPRLHERARCTLAQIDYTIKSVRQIINDLRPNVLDLGLGAAVEWQITQFHQRSGIVCELIEPDGEIAVADACAIAYFRILQESLSNVLRHAHASLVRVELRQQEGVLSMSISDNGVGLHARSRNKSGSFGLVGIEERVNLLGGSISISGSPHTGTTIRVSVPLEQATTRPRLDVA